MRCTLCSSLFTPKTQYLSLHSCLSHNYHVPSPVAMAQSASTTVSKLNPAALTASVCQAAPSLSKILFRGRTSNLPFGSFSLRIFSASTYNLLFVLSGTPYRSLFIEQVRVVEPPSISMASYQFLPLKFSQRIICIRDLGQRFLNSKLYVLIYIKFCRTTIKFYESLNALLNI